MASQLFGHREGAFTGASQESIGCFRAAEGGTIFLDEIGELELSLQAKLLRVLQERVVVPVGDHQGVPVNVRVVAATNRDLEQEVREGRFREDLFYRLNVVSLPTISLAQRPDDIKPLALGFIEQLASEGLPYKNISSGGLQLLEQFSWPGNVRQLKNFIEQAVVDCDGSTITTQQMQQMLQQRVGSLSRRLADEDFAESAANIVKERRSTSEFDTETTDSPTWPTLENLERQHLQKTLDHTFNNRSAAARLLGISRQALLRKLKKYDLESFDIKTSK